MSASLAPEGRQRVGSQHRTASAIGQKRTDEALDGAISVFPTLWLKQLFRASQVHVAERDGNILGVLELLVTDEGFLLDSVAVDPSAQGTGIGRQLLEFAENEARRQGFQSIYLMTNEKMTENQELYARIGYVLFDKQTVHGYSRVLMRKPLA
jgi:GNAT superfamily N-acetyltransferase